MAAINPPAFTTLASFLLISSRQGLCIRRFFSQTQNSGWLQGRPLKGDLTLNSTKKFLPTAGPEEGAVSKVTSGPDPKLRGLPGFGVF